MKSDFRKCYTCTSTAQHIVHLEMVLLGPLTITQRRLIRLALEDMTKGKPFIPRL